MEVFWFWILVILAITIILAWPAWPHTRERWPYTSGGGFAYGPSALAAGLLLLLLLIIWLGAITVWLPWLPRQ